MLLRIDKKIISYFITSFNFLNLWGCNGFDGYSVIKIASDGFSIGHLKHFEKKIINEYDLVAA